MGQCIGSGSAQPDPVLLKFLDALKHPDPEVAVRVAFNSSGGVRRQFVRYINETPTSPTDITKVRTGSTPLHVAVDAHRADVVKLLIYFGADVNAQDSNSYGPLHVAAIHGDCESIRLLLLHGAVVDALGAYGATPLLLACQKGTASAVELLIENKAAIMARNNNKWTPLHHASYKGDVDMIRILIAHKADIKAKDWSGSTPLHRAALNCKPEAAEALIGYGAPIDDLDKDGCTALYWAVDSGSANTCKVLADHGATIESVGIWSSLLHVAVNRNHPRVVAALLPLGVDVEVSEFRSTAIGMARMKCKPDLVALLAPESLIYSPSGRYRLPTILSDPR